MKKLNTVVLLSALILSACEESVNDVVNPESSVQLTSNTVSEPIPEDFVPAGSITNSVEEVTFDIVELESQDPEGGYMSADYGSMSDDLSEEFYYVDEEPTYEVQPFTNPPIKLWGRDLANYMTYYPEKGNELYSNNILVITGYVNQVFSDGVNLGGTFVGGIEANKNETITVVCRGAYAGGSWGISAVAPDCN